ncbi:MAG: glycosyltransferase family 4 protein [Pyrinomonadaceae bacterium]|nr:glycosyltransferase family 4 protein [Pyrinomonadaceae bacterium]
MQNETIKLAYLVSRYPAISHTFILREILHLKSKGFDICVASVNEPDRAIENLTEEEKSEAQKTYYIKKEGFSGAFRAHFSVFFERPIKYLKGLIYAISLGKTDFRKIVYGLFYFIEAVMLGFWVENRECKHLHVHFATPASTVALIAKKIFDLTFSITVHGPDEFYNVENYLLAEKIAESQFICCIGSFARSQLMQICSPTEWHKFEITPLGVDPAKFTPRQFNENSEIFEIICVGRLVPVKGQHILLKSVKELIDQKYKVHLRLVGDGPDRQSLENYVQENRLQSYVTFEGAVNQDRIRALYAKADIFVLASFAEGIPVVLMEAMAMEIPCVTTHITGIPELIRNNIDGILVAPSDETELALAIESLINSPKLRLKIGKAGRKRVIEKYNLEPNTNRLGEVFRTRLSQIEAKNYQLTKKVQTNSIPQFH